MTSYPLIYYVALNEVGEIVADEINVEDRFVPRRGERIEFTEGMARLYDLPGRVFEVKRVKRFRQLKLNRSVAEALGDYRERECIEVTVAAVGERSGEEG